MTDGSLMGVKYRWHSMKKLRLVKKLAILVFFLCEAGAFAQPITLESLLAEMIDPDANTYFPDPAFKARLWSSYDRQTTTADKSGWFANDDNNKFLRTEKVGGRTEEVMLDAKGPGAITRFWITCSGGSHEGDLRLYIDGRCLLETNCVALVSGGVLSGAPLSDSVSKRTPLFQRGHNLYLPIPYAKSCKVAYLRKPGTGGAFYYNVETRAYAPGTEVESLSFAVLDRARPAIDAANRALARRANGDGKPIDSVVDLDGAITPGGACSRVVTRRAGGAIRRLAFTLTGDDANYLRSTVLELSFDGERTLWVPAGEFFGCGPVYEAFTGWFTSCPGADQFESRWSMPFEKTCTITIYNYGPREVRLANAVAEVGPYAWDAARSMHFGACWHAYADVRSRTADKHEPWDFDYAELKGRGLFVGTTMSLWQEITDWWGEGDEKVFVDGEKTPSYVGTGSEDHFGYAWGSANIFSHPFLSQPVGITTGRALRADTCRRTVVNIRNRALDAIPFTTSCRFLMEMWHWKDVKIDFAPLACYYLRPGGTSNHGLDVEAAKRPARVDTYLFREFPLPKGAVLFADFEGRTYGTWRATGDCFGDGPARGTLPKQNPVDGYNARGLVNTYFRGDLPIENPDDTTGTLTSPAFTIEKDFINFLVGGGNYKGETCVNLVVDGKVERTAQGTNHEHLDWTSWNVKDLKGRKAEIVVVDRRKGHFGHINVDMIYFDDKPRAK